MRERHTSVKWKNEHRVKALSQTRINSLLFPFSAFFLYLFIFFFVFVAKSFKATGRPKTRRVCEVKWSVSPNHHTQSWKLCSFFFFSAPTKDALSQIRSPPWRSDVSLIFFLFSQHRSYRRKCHFSYPHQLVLVSLNLLLLLLSLCLVLTLFSIFLLTWQGKLDPEVFEKDWYFLKEILLLWRWLFVFSWSRCKCTSLTLHFWFLCLCVVTQ